MKPTTQSRKTYKNGDRLPNGLIFLNNMEVPDAYYKEVVTDRQTFLQELSIYIRDYGFIVDGLPTCTVEEAKEYIKKTVPSIPPRLFMRHLFALMPPFRFGRSLNHIHYDEAYYPIIDM